LTSLKFQEAPQVSPEHSHSASTVIGPSPILKVCSASKLSKDSVSVPTLMETTLQSTGGVAVTAICPVPVLD